MSPLWSSEYASIDPTFNAIHPRGAVLQRDLANLLGMGPWPPAMLAPFMHELTHHWCFRTTTGNILAATNLRSCEVALFGTPDPAALVRAAHDHLTFRAIMEFLRPLSEGMALFAEFDSRPGAGKVISDPQQFAWLACATGAVHSQRELSAMAARTLRAERISPGGVARKVSVLKHPSGDLGRVYFEGYLMVRSLHRVMCRSVPQAEETDWFLCYLRDYVFSDPGLVIAILSDPPTGLSKIDAVIRYIAERLWAFLNIGEKDAHAYNTHANDPSGPTSQAMWPAGIGSNRKDEQHATALVEKFHCWHHEPCRDEQARWRAFVARLLEQRRVAVAAAEQVPIRVSGGSIEALFTDEQGALSYIRCAALDRTLSDREMTGWAAILLCFEVHPVIATAFGDTTGVLAVQTRPHDSIDDPIVRSRLIDSLVTPPALDDLKIQTEEAHRLLREEVMRRWGETEVQTHARHQARRVARLFIDMMSEEWRYGWELGPEEPDLGRGRPSVIFENAGAWSLFAPNATMLNTYLRAAAGARLSSTARRDLENSVQKIEDLFRIRLLERRARKVRYWL